MVELNRSKVLFMPDEHRYFLEGKELQGITGVIHKHIFPDMYKNIPQFVLNKAAERGSQVHQRIEMLDAGFYPQKLSPELRNYILTKKENNLTTIANEYIVSDNENFASAIDLVFERDGEVILADIKTTSVLNKEYVRWQLSIYAYFFELLNPNLKVSKLYALWLRDEKSAFVEVERIDVELIKELLRCEVEGKMFINPLAINTNVPSEIKNAEIAVYTLITQIKELEEKKKELQSGLLKLMQDNNVTSYKGEYITLSRRAAYARESIDSKKLKAEYPEAYAACIKKTNISESLQIK